jgi:hypothetical protein
MIPAKDKADLVNKPLPPVDFMPNFLIPNEKMPKIQGDMLGGGVYGWNHPGEKPAEKPKLPPGEGWKGLTFNCNSCGTPTPVSKGSSSRRIKIPFPNSNLVLHLTSRVTNEGKTFNLEVCADCVTNLLISPTTQFNLE